MQLSRPLPRHTCYRDTSGRVRPLVKECGCITHEGPHWLDSDRSWRESNRRIITDRPDAVTVLTLRAFAAEEVARLREKGWAMKTNLVAALLTDEEVAALTPASELVPA